MRRTPCLLIITALLVLGVGLGVPATASALVIRGTRLASVSSDGDAANGPSRFASFDGAGSSVAFVSEADDLVAGDGNGVADVFLRNLLAGTTVRVSRSAAGAQANGESGSPALAADGRYCAFDSLASDIVSGDTNLSRDVFVYDTTTGTTKRVSVASGGVQANWDSEDPAISADGDVIAFASQATNLVAGDTNAYFDVFVHVRSTNTTTRVSVGAGGVQALGDSTSPSISADGRYIAFQSTAPNLVSGDSNMARDVFVYDRETATTRLVSASSGGVVGNLASMGPAISGNGRFVAFYSLATNLADEDTNDRYDVFVRDLQTGVTSRVSSAPLDEGDGHSLRPTISTDGRLVAFESVATNLVNGDTNGLQDVVVVDRQTGRLARASVSAQQEQSDGPSYSPSLAGDGSRIAFHSTATNLTASDSNNVADVFTVDLLPRQYVRVAGTDRYLTAVEASKRAFPNGADAVVLATGRNWPDALGGSALAGAVEGPLLLTDTDSLSDAVKAEITRLGARKVYILGGTGAVSPQVETALRSLVGADNVERLAGTDRYTTAREVAHRVIQFQGDEYDGGAFVATGGNFPDALAGSPIATAKCWPILLAHPTTGSLHVPYQVQNVVILGGTGAVSPAVELSLKDLLGTDAVVRKGGTDRYGTAELVARYGVENDLLWDGVGIATGENFPDALSGGAMIGAFDSVLLLTRTASLVPSAETALTDSRDRIGTVHIIGGTGAVSTAVEDRLKSVVGE